MKQKKNTMNEKEDVDGKRLLHSYTRINNMSVFLNM